MQYQKMNPEVKKIWLKALKSGEYKKGIQSLRSYDDEVCSLGVLCNLHAITHPKFASKETDPTVYDSRSGFLGNNVIKWSKVGMVEQSRLIHLNDTYKTFGPVIKFIEENL